MILNPLNDQVWTVPLTETNTTTSATTPLTTGTVTAFLATAKDSTTAADATLNCTVNYSGAGGIWTISLDASVLVKSLLDTLFGVTGKAYLIVIVQNAIWVRLELDYEPAAQAMVAA